MMSTELLTSFRRIALRFSPMRCLLPVVVLVLSADVSLACLCLPLQGAADELKRATAVFSGKVIKVRKHKEPANTFANVEAVFEVEKVWKGIDEETIGVFTSSSSISCGYNFKKGITYLVYAYGDVKLSTNICSRTRTLDEARDDLHALGTGRVIAQPASDRAGSDVRSQRFTKQVQDLAREFAQRLKKTREFKPEGDKLFTDSFVDCHLQAELERKENNIFRQIGASISPEIASQARADELRRYLIAQLNFFHLKTLHRMSTRDLEGKWDASYYTAEQEYPPGVYDLLIKNSAIAAVAVGENRRGISMRDSIKDLREMRTVLPTFEQAISAMREYFMAHPPEETELYKKNMERIGNDKNHPKFWEVTFHNTSADVAKEGRGCLGFTPGLMATIKIPPFYNLFVFQTGNRFVIGSLDCTEPPCVD